MALWAIWIHRNERLFRGRGGNYRWSNPRCRGIDGILVFQDMMGGKKLRMDGRIHVPLSISYMGRSLIFKCRPDSIISAGLLPWMNFTSVFVATTKVC